ncbi:hypothetical protein SKAU_G00416280 [Synaphobranchus kaupii]|uniref:Pericentrin/AKAP-450 centrosomal targeting domain-containing protein n=1 Tax=Synaphobranchus kaupii TaxID=118154 RepID=A0A9Q1E7G4_SYNKA|nr:hypothetical protein SKAU_G00416280 [Synaphobranchus kaupii]
MPEGARRDNEIDVLPDRIKSLLREVHQEGMQVLSLSELPVTEGEGKQEEAASHLKCQGWLKERESLLTSVERLKALISTMQTQREREDIQQSEAMGILQSTDRLSLLMEVCQLKAQLQHLQQEPRITGGAEQQDIFEIQPGVLWDHDALQSERMLLDELKAELAQTKLELETTLKAQQKHLTVLDTLRTEVTEKAAEVDILNKKLIHEQRKSRELQWAFEKEKCKSEKKDQKEREELEDVRLLLKEQQREVTQLSEDIEKERWTSTQLKQQVEHRHAQHHSLLSREQSHVSELQVQLESAQTRALELGSALERERELHGQLRHQQQLESQQYTGQALAKAADECSQMGVGVCSVEVVLESLQSQLDEKHAQVVQLVGEVERLKLEVVQAKLEWNEQRQVVQHSQEALRKQQEQLLQLQSQVLELQRQLDRKNQQVLQLQLERDRLQDQVSEIQGFAETLQPSTQTDLWKEDEPGSCTQDWVLQEKISKMDSSSISLHEVTVVTTAPKLMDNIINQLQLIAAKIKTMTSNTAGRVSLEEVDSEGPTWLQNSVESVLTMLQYVSALSPTPQSTALLVGGSSNSLTERLLRQNAELTGFVSRLTEEKNDLRNSLIKLEKELRHNCRRSLSCHRGADSKDTVELLLASAREGWNRERVQLEKCVHQAETEVSRLRGKIHADSLWNLADSDAALKRIYLKYLRAESFRKALIYQKKYLLLLLGSFQDCEVATLSLIARMGGRSSQSLDTATQRRRGFTRFRSVVRVFIALSRMRYLVKRWYKTTETSSNSSTVNRNGQAQITANEERRESPYLHPGSVDGYEELRGSSRGQAGRNSARLNTAPTETGSLACSHVQNYDPDRALSDYISRLEALQRRLGNVQSGSSSYAQLHFGIRR